MDCHFVALSSMKRRISSEEESRESLGAAVTIVSEPEPSGSSGMAGGGVSREISSVPQADRSRLSAMNRATDRRIYSFLQMGILVQMERGSSTRYEAGSNSPAAWS